MNKRIHVFYSGRVQGVGFRFTVEDVALSLGLVGWVKNLRDGTVEVVAEAEETALKKFLEKIKEFFSSYIRDVEITWSEAEGEFNDFSISFW
jgi:acylphosphatase